MKTLYTSNYARQGGNSKSYGISVKMPKWYEGRTLPLFAPTWEIVLGIQRGTITNAQYAEKYISLINSRNMGGELINVLENIDSGSILLCYEAPNDFCHRHILRGWIMEQTDIKIEEWKNEKEVHFDNKNKNLDSLLDF